MIFNPFKRIFRTRYSPLSEVLRHNFLNKINDAFDVLFGPLDNLIAVGGAFNLGMVDYLSLGSLTLPLLFWRWTVTEKHYSKVAQVLFPLACILMAPVVLVRAIIASICLLASLPIVLLVHGISYFFSRSLIREALSLEVEVNDGATNGPITIGKALKKARGNFWTPEEAVRIDCASIHPGIVRENGQYKVMDEHDEPFFSLPQAFSDKPSQRTAMQALLRLNLFHYTEVCEKSHNPMVNKN